MTTSITRVISFMASCNGTAARAIIMAIDAGKINAKIGVMIANNEASSIVPWCERNGVKCLVINSKTNPDDEFKAITSAFKKAKTELICLSGYRKKIVDPLLADFAFRILNIHPALLPRHGGQSFFGDKIHADVLKSKDELSGVTIHLVTDEYDSGPILAQKEVEVKKDDTIITLGDRVRAEEPALYVHTVKTFMYWLDYQAEKEEIL